MAPWTRRRVSGATCAKPLATFDTVRTDTPACSATSRRLTAIVPPRKKPVPEYCIVALQRCKIGPARRKPPSAGGRMTETATTGTPVSTVTEADREAAVEALMTDGIIGRKGAFSREFVAEMAEDVDA